MTGPSLSRSTSTQIPAKQPGSMRGILSVLLFSLCQICAAEKPKIVFLDEPTTGLDPQARRNLWDLIRQIRDQGTTVVLTTHYMDEAESLWDRVAIVEKGKIIAIDTPDKLIDDLVSKGFERKKEVKKANLEDVFLSLTGQEWRE